MSKRLIGAVIAAAGLTLAATAVLAAGAYPVGFGPNHVLPQPHHSLIPTIKLAKPIGWSAGQAPVAA